MLEMTTINENQNGNVDSIPGGVSTGYQAQNTLISSIFNGFDNIHVSVDQKTSEATFHSGGSIEENGILYTLKSDTVIEIPVTGFSIYRFVLDNGVAPGTKNIVEFSILNPTWSSSKNGWYIGTKRVLNTVLDRTRNGSPLSIKRINSDGYERFSDTEFLTKHKNISFDYMELLRYNSPVNARNNTPLLNLIPDGGISVRNGAMLVQGAGNKIALFNILNPINYSTISNGGAVGSKGVAAQSYRTNVTVDPIVDTYCVADTANNRILVMVNQTLQRTITGPWQSVHGLEFNAFGDSLFAVDKIGSKIYQIAFATGIVENEFTVSTVLYDDIALYSGFQFGPSIGGQIAFLSRVTNPGIEYSGLYKTAVDILILYENGSSEKLHTLLYTSDTKRGVSFGDTGTSSEDGDYRGDHQTLFSVDSAGNFLFI